MRIRAAVATALIVAASGCLGVDSDRSGDRSAPDADVDGASGGDTGRSSGMVTGDAGRDRSEEDVAAAARVDAEAAAEVLRRYYAAIDAGRYGEAHRLWSSGGEASGQTLDEFAAGFADTRQVEVEVGTAGRVEGAAGSRYLSIPVIVRAENSAGPRRFEGTYVLRRSVVDGASPEQRAWRISSADLVERSAGVGEAGERGSTP